MINNLPKFYITLGTGNIAWEHSFLQEQFLLVQRFATKDSWYLVQFNPNQDNNPFQMLLIILNSFKKSRCFVDWKGKMMILDARKEQYMELP